MSVHNDPHGGTDALRFAQDWLASQGQGSLDVSPAHRIDRETSGVLILAWDRDVARTLQRAFEARRVRKIYRAVLRGSMKAKEGVWSFPLTDRAEGRKNPAGSSKDRVACETRFHQTRANPYLTEIEVDLGSGRQHQIRKHSAIAGHHIVGDTRYGDPKHSVRIEKMFGFARLLLHAEKIEIPDPVTGERMTLIAPLPREFSQVFE